MVGWFVPPIVIPAGLAIAFAVYALFVGAFTLNILASRLSKAAEKLLP